MAALLDRKLLIVTGKGGTGKTTVAAALARLAAAEGRRVLLCENDATGDVGLPFGIERLSFDPVEVEPNLFVMAMDTERALQEYLQLNLKLPFAVRVGPLAKVFDFVATAAPGVREVLTMGKLCWEVKRETYDLVVVDAAATGHIVSQLDSPDSIGELVTAGPLARQTAWMREVLRDPERTGAVLVTTAEEMPVSETIELAASLRDRTATPLAAVVVNRVLPALFVRDEQAVFEQIASEPAIDRLASLVDGDVQGVIEAARLGVALRNTQVQHLVELQEALGDTAPFLFIPQSFGEADAPSVVSEAVDALAAEIEQ